MPTIPVALRSTRRHNVTSCPNIGADYTPEEVEFLKAIDREKRRLGKVFLEYTEIYHLLARMGFRRIVRKGKRNGK